MGNPMDLNRPITRNTAWNIAIIGSAVVVLCLILAGLLVGITVVTSHLLYIPVILATYRYPRNGLIFSFIIVGIYVSMVLLIAGTSMGIVQETAVRSVVILTIGALISLLSSRLRESEDLYRGLFDHSESGSILVYNTGSERQISEINEKAEKLLLGDRASLKGVPLTVFWDREEENKVFSALDTGDPHYTGETTFLLAAGRTAHVQVSIALLPGDRAILTFSDITTRVQAEQALLVANGKLNLLSKISTDHLQRNLNEIRVIIRDAMAVLHETSAKAYLQSIGNLVETISRHIDLSLSYRDLGASVERWQRVQEELWAIDRGEPKDGVSVRYWAERLEILADPLFGKVLDHVVSNAFSHAGTFALLTVRYREEGDAIVLGIEDNGTGIPDEKKQQVFEYDPVGHVGIGLFICRQIVEVSGMTLTETGEKGKGARFEIRVPPGNWRIEGSGDDAPRIHRPPAGSGQNGMNEIKGMFVRELLTEEFPLAESLWTEYHGIKGDPAVDRIFASYREGEVVSVARCRKHSDGYEVDGVFTPEKYRGHGYANGAVGGLVEACGGTTLYMHAVRELVGFYRHSGFVPIDEKELPPTIRDRYAWAGGEMEGADVCPMRR
jgi:PAS domain S-box-containing protein